jgi:hypothetical protein
MSDNVLAVLAHGDISKLTPNQQVAYYEERCKMAGLDPRSKPFQLLTLNGKMVLYCTNEGVQQLAFNRKLKVAITDRRVEFGVATVTVHVEDQDGRMTDDIGCVTVGNIKNELWPGEAQCNALMKAVTKAKRRSILSLCGLGESDWEGAADEGKPSKIPAELSEKPLPNKGVAALLEPTEPPLNAPAKKEAVLKKESKSPAVNVAELKNATVLEDAPVSPAAPAPVPGSASPMTVKSGEHPNTDIKILCNKLFTHKHADSDQIRAVLLKESGATNWREVAADKHDNTLAALNALVKA